MNWVLTLLQEAGLAAVPAVGFGMLFNVPIRMLGYCALGGAAGRGIRWALLQADMPIEWATLLAATAVSFLGVYSASRLRAHPKVFTVAAMIPMIPGVYLFTALIALATIQEHGFTPELWATAVSSGLKGVFIVSALAVGLAVPGLLLYRTRPVV